MISPEMLRRYPFFCCLEESQNQALAMLADEIELKSGTTLFEEGQTAEALYFLLEGGIDLYYKAEDKYRPQNSKEFLVGSINPGEVFGISALIEPYIYSATARVSQDGRAIKIEAAGLRALCNQDCKMGYTLMLQIAKAAMERLAYTRVQLAAAWA
jgi:CRP-like cAMP-binding protein